MKVVMERKFEKAMRYRTDRKTWDTKTNRGRHRSKVLKARELRDEKIKT